MGSPHLRRLKGSTHIVVAKKYTTQIYFADVETLRSILSHLDSKYITLRVGRFLAGIFFVSLAFFKEENFVSLANHVLLSVLANVYT